jgi:hypothetical protein
MSGFDYDELVHFPDLKATVSTTNVQDDVLVLGTLHELPVHRRSIHKLEPYMFARVGAGVGSAAHGYLVAAGTQ